MQTQMKSSREKPNIRILQNRYFSVTEIRSALRDLGIGIDNAEFKRLWNEEIVSPPDVLEPQVVLWKYDHARELIMDIYKLKGREDEYDVREMDSALIRRKELIRYRHMARDYYTHGKFPPY